MLRQIQELGASGVAAATTGGGAGASAAFGGGTNDSERSNSSRKSSIASSKKSGSGSDRSGRKKVKKKVSAIFVVFCFCLNFLDCQNHAKEIMSYLSAQLHSSIRGTHNLAFYYVHLKFSKNQHETTHKNLKLTGSI